MFNTNSTCRIGQWKIVVGRNVRQGDVVDKSQIELYNLDKDLSETADISNENPQRLEQLVKAYEEYRSNWTIRPEAVMHREEKRQKSRKSTPTRTDAAQKGKPQGPSTRSPKTPEDAQSSGKQKATIEGKDGPSSRSLAELRKELANVFTEEQAEARSAAKKKALEEGKKGRALRDAVDAAVTLTGEQKKRIQELRQQIAEVMRQRRDERPEASTDEQKATAE